MYLNQTNDRVIENKNDIQIGMGNNKYIHDAIKFETPKKEEIKPSQLSKSFKKFLTKKEVEEQMTTEKYRSKETLLASKYQDKKSTRRVNYMPKKEESVNQSIIDNTFDITNAALTLPRLMQSDENNYGNVKQEVYFDKMVGKCNIVLAETTFEKETLEKTKSANQSVIDNGVDIDNATLTHAPGRMQSGGDDNGYVSQEASAHFDKMIEKYYKILDMVKFKKASQACTKSTNQSVIIDAVDNENTAVTFAEPIQPDTDDHGYVSTETSAYFDNMIDKYSNILNIPGLNKATQVGAKSANQKVTDDDVAIKNTAMTLVDPMQPGADDDCVPQEESGYFDKMIENCNKTLAAPKVDMEKSIVSTNDTAEIALETDNEEERASRKRRRLLKQKYVYKDEVDMRYTAQDRNIVKETKIENLPAQSNPKTKSATPHISLTELLKIAEKNKPGPIITDKKEHEKVLTKKQTKRVVWEDKHLEMKED